MSKQEFWTHWVIGIAASIVWLWGKQWNLPPEAIALAAITVPGLIGRALGRATIPANPFRPADSSATPAAAAAPQQPAQPE